jgi:hypothetical protein
MRAKKKSVLVLMVVFLDGRAWGNVVRRLQHWLAIVPRRALGV